jgi:site-specific DNA recombinase
LSAKEFKKINDLSHSPIKRRYLHTDFVPETNLAVAMGRVSIKKNKDHGNSDLAQLEVIEKYALGNTLDLVKTWDVAETASKPNKRKYFREMIEYVRSNPKVKHVIFSHQSRSNRNRDSARELEALLKLGVTLHFARDGRKLTNQSDLDELLMWDVQNILNEKFIKDHTRNVMDGMIKRVEMGLFPGKAPYGYRNFRRPEDELSIFVINPDEALYIKKAFDLFSMGHYSEMALKRELDLQFPKLVKKPEPKRFSEILRNPFYHGDFVFDGITYKGHPEYHPPIIPFELWKRVQDILRQPQRSKRKLSNRNHPYLGLIKCSGRILDHNNLETEELCGCSVTPDEKRKNLASGEIKHFYYYHCSNNSHRRCSQREKGYMTQVGRKLSYTEAEIEELFITVFSPISFTPKVCKWMQDILMKEHHEKSREHYVELSALQSRHKMLEQYINKAYEDKLAGHLDEETWRGKHEQWKLEREQLKQQIDLCDDKKEDYIQKGVLLIELAQHTETVYKKASAENKRKLVEAVSSNHKLRNGTIEFDYRKPFDLLAKSTPKENWWS